jgi:hypothetical protein
MNWHRAYCAFIAICACVLLGAAFNDSRVGGAAFLLWLSLVLMISEEL